MNKIAYLEGYLAGPEELAMIKEAGIKDAFKKGWGWLKGLGRKGGGIEEAVKAADKTEDVVDEAAKSKALLEYLKGVTNEDSALAKLISGVEHDDDLLKLLEGKAGALSTPVVAGIGAGGLAAGGLGGYMLGKKKGLQEASDTAVS